MPNIEKLDELLAWAEKEDAKREAGLPSHWKQGLWIAINDDPNGPPFDPDCGTACCIAGKTALDAGAKPRLVEDLFGDNYWSSTELVMPDGSEVNVEGLAAVVLDLTTDQADHLFSGSNDIDDIRAVVAAIKDGLSTYDELSIRRWGPREDESF